jgi:5-methylcytosine-specific restriction endonuclease McrA
VVNPSTGKVAGLRSEYIGKRIPLVIWKKEQCKECDLLYREYPEKYFVVCSKCGTSKPLTEFKKRAHGYSNICKTCNLKLNNRNLEFLKNYKINHRDQECDISKILKKCTKCHELKPLTEYHQDNSTNDGFRTECKACKLKIDEIYRENNAGKRRRHYLSRPGRAYTGIIDPDIDGYITTLMKNEHFCWYCNKRIIGKKNLEHIVPLVYGGTHTKDNLAIACQSCNDSKGQDHLMNFFLRKNRLWKTNQQLFYYHHPDIKASHEASREQSMLYEVIGWDLEEYEQYGRKRMVIYYLK